MGRKKLYGAGFEPSIKTKKRVSDYAEVLTQSTEIEAMIDLIGDEASAADFLCLEPACGSGKFLTAILKRKFEIIKKNYLEKNLKLKKDWKFFNDEAKEAILQAISSLFGIDILPDNVFETRENLYNFILQTLYDWRKSPSDKAFEEKIRMILEKNILCGDFLGDEIQIAKIKKLKFDCIIGNPPYHLKTGGVGGSSSPVYQKFILEAKRLNARYISMIIPARWYTGGKGLRNFRNEMLNDRCIKVLVDFVDARQIFPNIFLRGGVCYFLRDKCYEGDCTVVSNMLKGEKSTAIRPLAFQENKKTGKISKYLQKQAEGRIFIRYNEAISILKKVQSFKEPAIEGMISSERPFGIRTFFKGKNLSKIEKEGAYKVYCRGGVSWVEKEKVTKNLDLIDGHKILIPRAFGLGGYDIQKIRTVYAEPNSLCSETYNVFGGFKTKNEALCAEKYVQTKFFRFLLGLKKNTMMAPKACYSFIPIQDFTRTYKDFELYQKYGLTEKEIAFIEKFFRR